MTIHPAETFATLKEEKEAFVSGHTGTTVDEILLVCTAPVFCGLFLFHEMRNLLLFAQRKCEGNDSWTQREVPFGTLVIMEALFILLPMAICQTEFLFPWGLWILFIQGAMAFALRYYRWMKVSLKEDLVISENTSRKNTDINNIGKRSLTFLTSYRSTVSYLTFVAILAVDFHIFPRRYAKTEERGYGLMDLGAGSFVVSGGFVSSFARHFLNSSKISKRKGVGFMRPVIIRSIPLIIMGIIRLITTKGLEYQEHVSEYGVHWNFFFTLCIVWIFSSILRKIYLPANFMLPVILLGVYQFLLSQWNVQEFIENGSRQCSVPMELEGIKLWLCNIFAANREGILGCIGYLCIHFFSENIGQFCLWNSPDTSSHNSTKEVKSVWNDQQGKRLLLITSFFWILHWFTTSVLGIPVSRRSTNASFIFWTLAHNLTVLSFIWVAFELGSVNVGGAQKKIEPQNPPIFAAVNRHGLIVFILANLMTGAVNLTINTLEASRTEAILVIFLYLCAVGIVALFTDRVFMWKKGRTKQD